MTVIMSSHTSHKRSSVFASRIALLSVVLSSSMAIPPPVAAQAISPPIESGPVIRILIDTVGGQVRCAPSDVRIPPRSPVGLEIVSQADQPLWFVAPDFFREAKVPPESEKPLDRIKGGVLMAPNSRVRMTVVSPDPGRFSYSCAEVGQAPHPLSHGVVIVTSPD